VSHTYDVKSSEFSCQLMIYFFLSRSEGRGVLHAVHIDLQNRAGQGRVGQGVLGDQVKWCRSRGEGIGTEARQGDIDVLSYGIYGTM
jgi:hypothetical protein